MAISKRLTELMGGTLSLESKLGEGTCFTLDLPVELGAKVAADEDVKSTEDAMPDFSQYTILVVEDDPVSMSLHTAMLGVTKAQLLKANNGQEAVDIVAANGKIDAVLMDQKMPVMDGNTATEIIKALRPNLPVVLLTANIRIGFHESIVQEPFDLVLAKPLNRVLLLKKLAEILRT